ncbi:Uncharacterised protein r2_g1549 [Pycnogonum litorale]
MKDKSPAQYQLVRCMDCINPSSLTPKSADVLANQFKNILDALVSSRQVSIYECDKTKYHFECFINQIRNSSEFCSFKREASRLDILYHSVHNDNSSYKELWTVIRLLLLLSHGQATVERGFSINKEITTTNISEQTLVVRRVIKDHILAVGGLDNVIVNKQLMAAALQGSHQYREYLTEMKDGHQKRVLVSKRKIAEEEIENL